MFRILSTMFCILATSFVAATHPAPGQWGVTGQYLYLQPSVDDTYFVIESRTPPPGDTFEPILIGEAKSNQFNFASAYRVGVEYAFCECNRGFGIYYTNLDTSHRRRVADNFLTPTRGIEDFELNMLEYRGRAYSKISVDYQSLDLLVNENIYQCCGLDFSVLWGLELTKLHFHQFINYLPLSSENTYSSIVDQRADTRGLGPKIGFEFDYGLNQYCGCLPGGLKLNLFSTASLLVTRSKARTNISYENEEIFLPFYIDLRKSTRVIPAFHMGVGLNYSFCGDCYAADIGVGYEFSTYLKSLLTMTNNSYYGSGLTNIEYSDFSAQGLFVSLSVQF